MVVWRSQLIKPTNPTKVIKYPGRIRQVTAVSPPGYFHVKCATKDSKQFRWFSAIQNQDYKILDAVKILSRFKVRFSKDSLKILQRFYQVKSRISQNQAVPMVSATQNQD